jgi:hypothetical protein
LFTIDATPILPLTYLFLILFPLITRLIQSKHSYFRITLSI